MAPGELVVSEGITSTSTDSAASAASPEFVPSIRKLCSLWRSPPSWIHTPTTPLQMIITAE